MNIEIADLVKKYNDKVVLNIESLFLTKGKIYGIIGPNGAGKSTLLKLIGNIEEKTGGKILYNGELINEKIIKEMTYTSQKPYLFRTSVYKNIAYPLKFRRYNEDIIRKKVNDIMKEFQIKDLELQLATSLSGGESQKVALARTLVFNPSLLLLDEPTANIDPNYIEHIEKILLKSNREMRNTIVIVTHNVSQARRICDEIIFLKKGRIIEQGNTEEVIFRPKREETKRFLSIEYDIS